MCLMDYPVSYLESGLTSLMGEGEKWVYDDDMTFNSVVSLV